MYDCISVCVCVCVCVCVLHNQFSVRPLESLRARANRKLIHIENTFCERRNEMSHHVTCLEKIGGERKEKFLKRK